MGKGFGLGLGEGFLGEWDGNGNCSWWAWDRHWVPSVSPTPGMGQGASLPSSTWTDPSPGPQAEP